MYKGYKVTKKLQDYIGFAKNKFDKLNEEGNEAELWDVLAAYDFIMDQAICVQHYIYDLIMGDGEYEDKYRVCCGIDGGVYVRGIRKIP